MRVFHFVGLQAIFWHPGWFAWYFVVVFALVLGLWTTESGVARRVLGAAIVAGYFAFLLNPERGGLVALHVTLIVFVWDRIRRAKEPRRVARRLLAVAIPIVVLGLLAVGTPGGRRAIARGKLLSLERTVNNAEAFLTGDATDRFRASERLKLWSAALRMWRSAPLFGVGEGSFAWRFHDYVAPGSALDTPTYADAHSTWLQFLATRGFVGIMAYIALLVTLASTLWSALWQEWRDRRSRSTVTSLVLAFTGFVTYSFVYQLFYLQPIQLLFWLIVALTAARSADRMNAASRADASDRFGWGVAIAFVVAIAVQSIAVWPLFADVRIALAHEPRGFYPIEVGPEGARKRWSSSSGILCLDPSATHVRLRFEAVDPRVARLPRTVTLTTDGQAIDRFQIATTDVVTRSFDLPPPYGASAPVTSFGECTPQSRRLSIAVDRTWSPADVGVNADPRHLGVLVFEPIVTH
jgi:O-antigen ligase